jgi:tetraacyldisaccharide 4'-kinase
MVESLAREFQSLGRKPAILSRGYGRSAAGTVIVSAGQGPLVGPEEGGDEPVALSRQLPGVIVAVARRRVDAGQAAAALGADLFLLDDGFQHVELARDVDLLLLDARDPFGGARFPPRGQMREPLSAIARADAIIVTHATSAQETPDIVLQALARWNPKAPVFHARLPAAGLWDERGAKLDLGRVASGRSIAVSGVAEPRGFETSLSELGLSPREILIFRDHQRYRERHLSAIRRAAQRAGAEWVITTEKDAAKLTGPLPIPLACLRRRVEIDEPTFLPFLQSHVFSSTQTQTQRAGWSRP